MLIAKLVTMSLTGWRRRQRRAAARRGFDPRGELLPVLGGALVQVGYALVLAALVARLTLRRDLT